ncbi:PEP-CTERM sorting domain-containing protein [Cerasicoccus fimbriatus]|uniref:PEP-CTERM sorting domain-containing protein n=1 Tax=Cerasicoccus fimbriatus TaxID=3014554 RepID=UPI0022B2B51E|nr:PEP-CTERM sorting domain-containing protein [Cerasicoccus sp. TK19100]
MIRIPRFTCAAMLGAASLAPVWADTTVNVSTYAQLVNAVNNAGGQPPDNGQYTIQFTQDLIYDGTSATNLFTLTKDGSPLVIDGGGFSLDMQSADRAFFVVGGSVTIQNMEIANAVAKGGSSNDRAGGGMGAGGAIFVADGGSISNGGYWTPTALTLRDVSFTNNQAQGGNSSYTTDSGGGGGGGLGGDGGTSYGNGFLEAGSAGGGGGVGLGGAGGSAYDGGANDGGVGDFLTAGYAGSSTGGQSGGLNGGGGGAYYDDEFLSSGDGAGGGGGVGGQDAFWSDEEAYGGAGGWGGGGGGAGKGSQAGAGGFGGGGGAASAAFAGNGGFGGGGGGANGSDFAGEGGFGAGDGGEDSGGGGLGAGGAVYAMKGVSVTIDGVTFNNNSAVGGTSNGDAGMAIGNDLFLGSDVVFNIDGGETLTFGDNSLGGAGFAGAGDDSNDDAKGRLTVQGGGEMVIQGSQSYAGTTFVNGSTVTLAAGSTSTTSDYQVYGSGATLNIAQTSQNIAPITQSAGTVNITGSGNTIIANQYTPSAITDVLGLSGGVFNIDGDNTTVDGTVQISGATVNVNAQNVSFTQLVTLVSGMLETSEPVTMDGLTMQGGQARFNHALTLNGNLLILGGDFRHNGKFNPSGSSTVTISGGKATFIGGDNGGTHQYTTGFDSLAEFSGNFENSSFVANASFLGSAPTLRFVGASALPSLETVANSITVFDGATLDLHMNGDVGEIYSAVITNDLAIYEGAIIVIDLYSNSTIPISMGAPTGTLDFWGTSGTITIRLDEFGDTLAPGEPKTYTIIGSVENLDLNGAVSVLSRLVFDPGENTGLTGIFSGLDPNDSNYYDLEITLTNNVPEPAHYALMAGAAVLGLMVRRRRR